MCKCDTASYLQDTPNIEGKLEALMEMISRMEDTISELQSKIEASEGKILDLIETQHEEIKAAAYVTQDAVLSPRRVEYEFETFYLGSSTQTIQDLALRGWEYLGPATSEGNFYFKRPKED